MIQRRGQGRQKKPEGRKSPDFFCDGEAQRQEISSMRGGQGRLRELSRVPLNLRRGSPIKGLKLKEVTLNHMGTKSHPRSDWAEGEMD